MRTILKEGTSEDEEGKKERQIPMEALDRLKLKKRNDEVNMFKHSLRGIWVMQCWKC